MRRTVSRLLAVSALTLPAAAQVELPWYFTGGGGPGTIPRIQRSEFADLDGNGLIDVLTWWEDTLFIHRARVNGEYELTPQVPLAAGTIVRGVGISDVDGDGDLDLAVCGELPGSGFVEGFLNDGSGTFASVGWIVGGPGEVWSMASFGDIDGQGPDELMAFESASQQLAVFWNVDFSGAPSVTNVPSGPGESPTQVHDLDGDGDGDLLRSSPTAEVVWHENLGGSGPFGPAQPLGVSGRGRSACDLDGDGDLDVVASGAGGPVRIENLGSGQFAAPTLIEAATVIDGTDCQCVDIDLDGDMDVTYVWRTPGNSTSLVWLPNDGTGQFGALRAVTSRPSLRRTEFLDADGDGDLDVYHSSADPLSTAFQGSALFERNLTLPMGGMTCETAVSLDEVGAAWSHEAAGSIGTLPWSCGPARTEFWLTHTVDYDDSEFSVNLRSAGVNPPFACNLEIFEGSCGALTPVRCGTTDFGNMINRRVDPAVPLQTYYIRIGLAPGMGHFGLTWAGSDGNQVGNCIDNASFESGELDGWTATEMPGPFVPLEVARGGESPGFGMFATEPTSGDFVFRTGFDGDGPGRVTLSQDLFVTSNSRFISFNYRAGWAIMNPAAVEARTFEVVIREPGSGAVLRRETLLTAPAQTTNLDTGSQVATIDLSDFTAQTVGFSFEWFVPESNMGPGHFQLDNINCPRTVGPLVGASYCTAAVNSSGSPGKLRASGSDDASDNSLRIVASDLPSNTFGLFLTSRTPDFVPGLNGASDGNLCIGGTIGRLNTLLNSGGAGDYSLAIDLSALPQGNGLVAALAGETWHFQSWFRDIGGAGSNLTDAVRITYQ